MRFSDSLDRKLEEIKRPPNLPTGHYIWAVKKHPDIDTFEAKSGDEWEKVTFQLNCVSPHDDVDEDELEEYGNVQGAMNSKVFMFNTNPDKKADFERTMFNLRRFLGHCGVDESLGLAEALGASVGANFLGELKHSPSPEDPEVIFTEVGRTAEV